MKRSLFFRLLTSRSTTTWVLLAIIGLLTVGMFVPQQVPADLISRSYPSSTAQVITGLDLHHIASSWLMQLSLVLLGLNLLGMLLRNQLPGEPRQVSSLPLADAARAPVPGPGESQRVDEVLRGLLPKWTVRRDALDTVLAHRGLSREGVVVTLLGITVLAGAFAYSEMSGARGVIQLLEGDDQMARSRSFARREQGDVLMPWRPGFTIRCMPSQDGTAFGPRQCLLDVDGSELQATLRPGRDLEFAGYRVSLTGVGKQPHVAGFRVDAVRDVARTRAEGAAGSPFDLKDGERSVATLLFSGTDREDPVAVLPSVKAGPEDLEGLRLEVRPRATLTLRVATTEHVPWVWGGVTLLLVGIGLLGLWPSYRLNATRRGSVWRLELRARGLFSRPARTIDALCDQLAARVAEDDA